MERKRRDLVIALLPLVLVPLGYAALHIYNVYFREYVLPCPVRTLLGFYCPGCGGTHCVYSLAHGHIFQAAHYNLFVFGLIALIALYWLQSVLAVCGVKKKLIPTSRAFWLTVAGIIAAYLILRNIIPALAPF